MNKNINISENKLEQYIKDIRGNDTCGYGKFFFYLGGAISFVTI